MQPKELQYRVESSYCDGMFGSLYEGPHKLKVWFDGNLSSVWTVYEWDHKPSQEEVMDVVSLGIRFIDCYNKAFTAPRLPEVVEWK